MHATFGLEALLQRGQSALFKDLVAIYQDSFDALQDMSKASHDDLWIALHHANTAERLTKRIQQDFGPMFKKVEIIASGTVNMYCSLRMTKLLEKTFLQNAETAGMAMASIARLYDDKTGALIAPLDPKNPAGYSFSLAVFTSLWWLRDDHGRFVIDAEMLAAGTLHEIGHVDQFIRASLRAYGNTLDAADVIHYIDAEPHPVVVATLIAALKTSRHLDKAWRKILQTVETQVKTPTLEPAVYREALSALALVATAELSARNLMTFDEQLMGYATSTARTRLHSRLDMERSADEFAARSGAYAALARFLQTLDALDTTHYHLRYRTYLPTGVAMILQLMAIAGNSLAISLEDICMGYDPLVRRMQLILETAKHAFQDDKLPEDVKADLRDQIAEGEASIKAYRDQPHHQIRSRLKAWCDKVATLGRIVKSPFENRLSRDYERLQEAQRSVSRHPLYYLHQLQQKP